MIIDTHCHLYSEDFQADFDDVIARARAADVHQYLLPNIDAASIEPMHRVCDRLPNLAFPMMGLHPTSVGDDYEQQLSVVEQHLFQPSRPYIGVGEIGIDLYWDQSRLVQQIDAFERQIKWAKELRLPIAIHVREAFDQTLEVVDRLMDERLSGVFHCFTGTIEQARHIASYGTFKLGIGGVLTFKNGKIDQFIHELDPDMLLIETDAPYLAPVPHRGKRNEPAFASLVVDKLAQCLHTSREAVMQRTTDNARKLFNLPKA